MIEKQVQHQGIEEVVTLMTSSMADLIERDLLNEDPTIRHKQMLHDAYRQFQEKSLSIFPNAAHRFVTWLEEKLRALQGEALHAKQKQQGLAHSLSEMRQICERVVSKASQGSNGGGRVKTEDLVGIS